MSVGVTSAQPFSFDDIDFWVGEGANRAALVIDWVEDSTDQPALAWGFRWNGTATGRTMLLAIVEADPRLYVKLGGPASHQSLYGVGYDANDDGVFGLRDGTQFDSAGIASGNPPFFGTTANDAADYYSEGWTFAFWHHGIASSNPYDGGTWSTGQGMSARNLADGSWDSWAFTPTFDFTAFAENPVAAPPAKTPGDFNGDEKVDAADYAIWRTTFGSIEDLGADANANDIVDAADYVVWRKYASSSAVRMSSALTIPEPPSAIVVLLTGLAGYRMRRPVQWIAHKLA